MFGFGVSATGESTPSNLAQHPQDSQEVMRATGFSQFGPNQYDQHGRGVPRQTTAQTTGAPLDYEAIKIWNTGQVERDYLQTAGDQQLRIIPPGARLGVQKGARFLSFFNPNHPSIKPASFAEYLENEKKFLEVEQLNRMRIAINRREQPLASIGVTEVGQTTLSGQHGDTKEFLKQSGAISD